MITITLEELIDINLTIGGTTISGISFDVSDEEYVERLMQANENLTAKGFIIDDDDFSDKFMAIAGLLDRYKESDHKIFINSLRIGLVEEGYAVVLELLLDDNEDEATVSDVKISFVPNILVIKTYIDGAEFLKGYEDDGQEFEAVPCTEAEFLRELNYKEWPNMMIIQSYIKGRTQFCRTYYFDNEEAFCFDYMEKTMQQKTSENFRLDLLRIFGYDVDGDLDGQA